MNHYHIFIALFTILLVHIVIFNIALIAFKEYEIIPSISAQSNASGSNSQSANYYVRFNCGTIDNDNGPLRPGKYDSDITIFNRQSFPLTIIWKSIEINQENNENFQVINIQPESIVNINCAKIFSSPIIQNFLNNKFIEGIVLIRINTDNGQLTNNFLNNQGTSIIIDNKQIENLINVDVLHTVNTLSDLNKQAFYLKVDFSVSGQKERINPQKENQDNLTAIFPVDPKSIIDPTKLVKDILIKSNNSTNYIPLDNLTIKIQNSQLLTNTFTDNHALTFQKILPVIANNTIY